MSKTEERDSQSWTILANVSESEMKYPFLLQLKLIKQKAEKGEVLSLKDKLFVEVTEKLTQLGKVDVKGNIMPLTKREEIGGMVFIPFNEYPTVTERWTKRYAPILNATVDKPNLTPIGKAIGLKRLYKLQDDLVDRMKKVDSELAMFEDAERFSDGLFRGIYLPVMAIVRVCQWHDKYYGTKPCPKWALPHLPGKRLRTIPLAEVEVENIHANVGFMRLVKLVDKGKTLESGGALYKTLLIEADRLAKQWKYEKLSPERVRAMVPPHAMGKRNQGLGRIIVMVAKVLFFIESTWAQPLQRYLETCLWYASGDRLTRFKKMKTVLDGPPGTFCVDGDDFIIKLSDGTLVAGDYSSYESSVRKIDHVLVWNWIVEAFSNLDMALVHNLGTASGYCDFVTGIGVAKRTPLQGVDSGRATTHSEESILNHATLMAADKTSIDSLVRSLTQMGRMLKTKAQMLTKRWVFLAKLACNGKVIFGSIVRALWGLAIPEDPPGLEVEEHGFDEYWVARSVAILSNVAEHPLFNDLMKIVKDAIGDTLKHEVAKITPAKITRLATAKMVKNRGRKDKSMSGIIERKSIKIVVDAIMAW